jgi:hypothetical protein
MLSLRPVAYSESAMLPVPRRPPSPAVLSVTWLEGEAESAVDVTSVAPPAKVAASWRSRTVAPGAGGIIIAPALRLGRICPVREAAERP